MQVGGEQAGFVPAGPGADFHHGIAGVGGLGRNHRLQHGLVQAGLAGAQLGQFQLRQLAQARVGLRVAQEGGVFRHLAGDELVGAVVFHQLPQLLLLTGDLRHPAGIGVERRLRHLRLEFVEAELKRGDVWQWLHALSPGGRKL